MYSNKRKTYLSNGNAVLHARERPISARLVFFQITNYNSVTIQLLVLTLCVSSKESTLIESPIFSSVENLEEEDDDALDVAVLDDAGLYVLLDEVPSYSELCLTSLALVM